MVQSIYGLIAIVLTMLLALNLFRITTSTERKMIFNEVATPMTGISVDLMEHIGNKYFDEATDESDIEPSDFPLVTSENMLTPESGFGNSGDGTTCDHTTPDFYDADCNDIDDFDGMVLERDVDGLLYRAEIDVKYVNATNPDTETGSQTYAKKVTITISTPSNPYLLIGNLPLSVSLSRVFVYKRITVTP